MIKVFTVFLSFMIYSMLGYIVEVIATSIDNDKINFSRGFLIGPYIPIYGTGCIIMSIFLTKYESDLIVLFVMGAVICTILEYITSFIMEKMYNLRWWDYSQKKYNINGRVCLDNALLFGLGGVIIVKIVNPFLQGLISKLPDWLLITISVILFIIFISDFIVSMWITSKVEKNIHSVKNTDATHVIKTEIFKLINNHKYLVPRLLDAYPNAKTVHNNEFRRIKDFMTSSKEEREKLKEEIREAKEEYRLKKEKIKEEKRLLKLQEKEEKKKK